MASKATQMTCSGHVPKKTLKWKAQEITTTAANAVKKVFKWKKDKSTLAQESDPKMATTKSLSTSHTQPHQKCPQVEIIDDEDNPSLNKEPTHESKESEETELGDRYVTSLQKRLMSIIAHIQKDWSVLIYAFYQSVPNISYNSKGCYYHEFWYAARGCKKGVHRFLATGDAK